MTDVPGLYLLGLSWQHTRGSAPIGWVGDDLEFLAARIGAAARADPSAGGGTADESYEGVAASAAGAAKGDST